MIIAWCCGSSMNRGYFCFSPPINHMQVFPHQMDRSSLRLCCDYNKHTLIRLCGFCWLPKLLLFDLVFVLLPGDVDNAQHGQSC